MENHRDRKKEKVKTMLKLLYGTGNAAKLEAMRNRLAELDVEILGLQDIDREIPEVKEDGATPLENARMKALAYYEAFGIPVFSCDSGLYFEGVPEEIQPGVHVRTVNGKYLTDEEMLEYYIGLARKYGDLRARYRNAICLVMDREHVYESMAESLASQLFLLTARPHSEVRHKGFPLDSLSVDLETGEYFYDLEEEQVDQVAVEDGFLQFFQEVVQEYGRPREFRKE